MEENLEAEIPSDELQTDQEQERPGLIHRTFRNRFGHWRAGWRLLIYAIAVYVVGKALTTVLKLFMASPSEAPFASWAHSVLWVVANVGFIGGALIVLRWFDRRPVGLLGLGFSSGWLREFGIGLAAGIGAIFGILMTRR